MACRNLKLYNTVKSLYNTVNDRFSGHIVPKTTILKEKQLVLFTGFEDMTALEDKKGRTVFSAKPVVDCIYLLIQV